MICLILERERNVLNVFNVEFSSREARDGEESLFGHEKGRRAWGLRAKVHDLNFDDVGLAWAISTTQTP